MKALNCEVLPGRNRFGLGQDSWEIPWIRTDGLRGTKRELVARKETLIWAIADKFKQEAEAIIILWDQEGSGWTIPAIASDLTGESAQREAVAGLAELFARLLVSTAEVEEIGLMLENNLISVELMRDLRAKWLDWSYRLVVTYNWEYPAMVRLTRFLQLAFDNWIGIGDEAVKMEVNLPKLIARNRSAAILWTSLNEKTD